LGLRTNHIVYFSSVSIESIDFIGLYEK